VHQARPARSSRRGHRQRKSIAALGPAGDDGQAGLSLEIYLARHGETEWSLSGRHTGSTDLPLTPHGEQQAALLKERLKKIHFDAVYSSPLQRARRTAALAGFTKPELTALLAEIDYGEYEGKTTGEIHQLRPAWELYKDGCPGGETPEQMHARAEDFVALASVGAPANGRVLAFSHGHFLRALAIAWMGLGIKVAGALHLDVATLSILRESDDKDRVLAMWNAP
jgi:broad specificity phosphatase PhoE